MNGSDFTSRNENDYRVKTKTADTQSGYLKEKIVAGTNVVINEIDGEVGKALQVNVSVDAASTHIEGTDGITAVCANNQWTISEDGKAKITESGARQYLGEAILADNGVQKVVSGDKITLSAPDLGKVKHNGTNYNLTNGSGVTLTENGNDLEVSANLEAGDGVAISENAGGKRITSNLVVAGNLTKSGTAQYTIKDKQAGITDCDIACFDVTRETLVDGYCLPKLLSDNSVYTASFINYIMKGNAATYGLLFVGSSDAFNRPSVSNSKVRLYYIAHSSGGEPMTVQYCVGVTLVNNANGNGRSFFETFSVQFSNTSGNAFGSFEFDVDSEWHFAIRDISIQGGIGLSDSTTTSNNVLYVYAVKWIHTGYDLKDSDI